MMRTTSLAGPARSISSRSRHELTARRRGVQRTRAFATTTRRQADDNRQKPPQSINLASLFDAQAKQTTTTQRSNDPLTSSIFKNMDTTPLEPQSGRSDLLLELLKGKSLTAQPSSRPLKLGPAPFKLDPRLGRTVYTDSGDLATAFRKLNNLCNQNNIRRDEWSQRFHERPGLKRKRVRSEKWRARFKTGFVEMVQRVQKMKKMGW